MRVIFSIVLNGLHHLLHNNQYRFILDNCDKWIVVEGASHPNGSTRWCKPFPEEFHKNGGSIDGTREFLETLSKLEPNIIYIQSDGFWDSKDQQVNMAIQELKKITNNCYLWEFDVDEQWTTESMNQAEQELISENLKTGKFRANCYVGKNLLAVGEWGESVDGGYNRLWNWEGELFARHEPPLLEGILDERSKVLTPRFNHYNYYFEQDVKFKDLWYGGHEHIHERWKIINSLSKEHFPIHISELITGGWGRTNSAIIWKDSK